MDNGRKVRSRMSLCPESEYRASLTDSEFWEHIYPDDVEFDYDFSDDDVHIGLMGTTCQVCGASSECGWDESGRPWIHCTPQNDDDE